MTEMSEKLVLELRRGTLVLSVLSQLHTRHYGYSLQQILKEKGIGIEQNTLYPLLRRLEKQGLLQSDWSVEGPRPRRYYRLSETGQATLDDLRKEWYAMVGVLDDMLRKENE